jgi:membrane protein YqaA with SNARE-associated domain
VGAIGGLSIGALIGGPVGAILGGILGSIVGWLFGTPIQEIQQKVYVETCEKLKPFLNKFCEDKKTQLKNLMYAFKRAARDNFEKASRNIVLLLQGK